MLGPAEVLAASSAFTRETGGQPDEVGSFFFGQVGADPGPLYYPRLDALSAEPVRHDRAGCWLLALVWRAAASRRASRAGWLLLFVLGFGLMMTLAPKKFDRYLLPIFPALVVLAELGWWLLLERLAPAAGAARPRSPGWRPAR